MTTEVKSWLADRKSKDCHRQLLVISGTQEWVQNSITEIFSTHTPKSHLCVGDLAGFNRIQSKQYRSVLGQEFEWIIYDGFSELRGNALLAMSGCVSQSGLMILLCPDLDVWSMQVKTQGAIAGLDCNFVSQPSAFTDWLVEHINTFPAVAVWQQHQVKLPPVEAVNINNYQFQDPACLTADQYQLVEYIKYAQAKQNCQIVVLADRGRGKSSALGIAAGQLINSVKTSFLVTSTHRSMTQQIFKQALRFISPNEQGVVNKVALVEQLQYLPFDKIIKDQPKADWLFVDEAASLPTEVLEKLVLHYPKVILSTTIHGYEGSGRGFELRFKPFLKSHFADFREFMLHTPIRWFENDPLEAFWHQVMALKTTSENSLSRQTAIQPLTPQTTNNELVQGLNFQVYSGRQLINQPKLLQDVFALLVDAHYQTSPDDLVRMLDANQQIQVLSNQQAEPIAVALTAIEGGKNLEPLAMDIAQGNRRIPGHLIPQRLAFDHCDPKLLLDSHIRIVRIAVKQQYRHKNLGSTLLTHIKQDALKNNIDFLGSSFGLTNALAKFWFKNEFQLVKLGIKQDASSGEFSAIMLIPLSSRAKGSIQFLSLICSQQINFQQDYRLKTLSPELIALVQKKLPLNLPQQTIDSQEMQDYWFALICQFSAGKRPLYSVEFALFKWLTSLNLKVETLTESKKYAIRFITDVIIKKSPYQLICSEYKLAGKKEIESHLRNQLQVLLAKHA